MARHGDSSDNEGHQVGKRGGVFKTLRSKLFGKRRSRRGSTKTVHANNYDPDDHIEISDSEDGSTKSYDPDDHIEISDSEDENESNNHGKRSGSGNQNHPMHSAQTMTYGQSSYQQPQQNMMTYGHPYYQYPQQYMMMCYQMPRSMPMPTMDHQQGQNYSNNMHAAPNPQPYAYPAMNHNMPTSQLPYDNGYFSEENPEGCAIM